MNFKSSLKKAIGLGSAKSGLHHWLMQRITAIALVPLSLWFVGLFIILITAPYQISYTFFSSTLNVALAILFIGATFYHGALGMQVIWEDYVHNARARWILIILTNFTSILLAILAILSILKMYIG